MEMSANQENKKLLVAEIKEKIQRAKSMIFVNYAGLKVNDATAMRHNFAKNGCEYKVYKNRLVLRALNDCGITGMDESLQESLGVAFGYNDEVMAAKLLKEVVEANQKMSIKFGIVNKAFVDSEGVMALAELPSKEVLIAKLLGMLNAPATSLAMALSGVSRKLVYALDAVAKTKN